MRADQENNIIARTGGSSFQLQIIFIPKQFYGERLGLKVVYYAGQDSRGRGVVLPLSEYRELFNSDSYESSSTSDVCMVCEESVDDKLVYTGGKFVLHSKCMEEFKQIVYSFLRQKSELIVKYSI